MTNEELVDLTTQHELIQAEHMNWYARSDDRMLEWIYEQNDLILYWLRELSKELVKKEES